MDITPRTRRLGALALTLAAVVSLAGCIIPAPGSTTPQQTEPAPAPSTTTPATTPATEPATDPTESAPATGQYALQNDPAADVVWSFEATSAERVAADANGSTPEAGKQLVILHVSGDVLVGEPDFYYQFTVQIIDSATGQAAGLSSGTFFYAEDDLFTLGQQASFVDADAIYEVPESWSIDTWRFTCNETGEVWDVQVPTS